jgi:hypothetical protein
MVEGEPLLSISIEMSENEADKAVSVVSFIVCSLRNITGNF